MRGVSLRGVSLRTRVMAAAALLVILTSLDRKSVV